ncbi:hypothetical protein Hanom_Chr16g01428931 [Helianthus anomalus]
MVVCLKNENLDDLANRYEVLIEHLKDHKIYLTDAEKIAKFADALPAEWIEILKILKKDSSFSKLHLKGFINTLKTHQYENVQKKKELLNIRKDNMVINTSQGYLPINYVTGNIT